MKWENEFVCSTLKDRQKRESNEEAFVYQTLVMTAQVIKKWENEIWIIKACNPKGTSSNISLWVKCLRKSLSFFG